MTVADASGADPIALPVIASARALNVLAFIIPALLAIPFSFVGRFWLGELLAIAVVPLALRARKWFLADRWNRMLFLWGSVWLVSLVVSDIWRGTAQNDIFRGWGEIVITLVMLFVMRVVIGLDLRRLQLALVGVCVGTVGRLLFFPLTNEAAVPWRLGGVWVLTVLVILGVSRFPAPFRRIPTELFLIGLAPVYFTLGSRNAAGLVLLAAGFNVIASAAFRRGINRLDRRRVVALLGYVAAIAMGVVIAYSWLASSGALGEDARYKYSFQSSGAFGVIVGGRQDVVAGAIAVSESPIVGYGSRFEGAEAIEIQNRALTFLQQYGYRSYGWDAEYIPSHSALLGAWVAAGILAVPFWIVVITVCLRALTVSFRVVPPWRGLTAFFTFSLLWDVLFSPFGGPGRTLVPLSLITLLMVTELRPGQRDLVRHLPSVALQPHAGLPGIGRALP